jgi:hypothetical protein
MRVGEVNRAWERERQDVKRIGIQTHEQHVLRLRDRDPAVSE